MRINAYEFQATVAKLLAEGMSTGDVWQQYKGSRKELGHLCGGSPSANQYADQIQKAIAAIRDEKDEAEELGPLAAAGFALKFRSIALAANLCTGLMSLEPATVTDLEDIQDSWQRLQNKVDAASLGDADLLLDGAYKAEIDALYGVKEAKEPTGEPDAG